MPLNPSRGQEAVTPKWPSAQGAEIGSDSVFDQHHTECQPQRCQRRTSEVPISPWVAPCRSVIDLPQMLLLTLPHSAPSGHTASVQHRGSCLTLEPGLPLSTGPTTINIFIKFCLSLWCWNWSCMGICSLTTPALLGPLITSAYHLGVQDLSGY